MIISIVVPALDAAHARWPHVRGMNAMRARDVRMRCMHRSIVVDPAITKRKPIWWNLIAKVTYQGSRTCPHYLPLPMCFCFDVILTSSSCTSAPMRP